MIRMALSLFALALLAGCVSIPLPPVAAPSKVRHPVKHVAAPVVVPAPVPAPAPVVVPAESHHLRWFH